MVRKDSFQFVRSLRKQKLRPLNPEGADDSCGPGQAEEQEIEIQAMYLDCTECTAVHRSRSTNRSKKKEHMPADEVIATAIVT